MDFLTLFQYIIGVKITFFQDLTLRGGGRPEQRQQLHPDGGQQFGERHRPAAKTNCFVVKSVKILQKKPRLLILF